MMNITSTRMATWDKVGTDIREANSVKEALQIAGMDYEVVKSPIYLSNGFRIKDQFATKKKGTDEVFGIVGKDYTIVQNEEAFSFVDGIIQDGLTFVKAGETSYMNYIIASLPEQYIMDDKFTPYIIFQNQFAMEFRRSTNKISLRHSSSVHDKMKEAQHTLQFTAEYMNTFTKQAEKLAATKISDESVGSIVDQYFLIDEEASTRKINSTEAKRQIFLNAYNAEDNQNFKGTAWGMINAFSDYITHIEPGRKSDKSDITKFVNVTFNTGLMENFINLVNSKI